MASNERITPLPTGTVTFLFTDIEGSTPLWERTPVAMDAALQIHNAILQHAITNHAGVVYQIIGDAFVAAFPTALQALTAALEAQRGLATAIWNETGALRVRMGLHTGEAHLDPHSEGYAVSPTTTRASRVMSTGHGGQVLLSQECADLCGHDLPEGVFLKDLGQHRLKGLAQPEHLFQVIATGLTAEFPALQTLDRFPNNLPLHLTSFIGREKESAEVQGLLKQTRLLTLSGVGGTGKTRLALHVASEVLEDYEDGVWLVELAKLTDPVLILSTVAMVFGFHEDMPGMRLETRLLHHLKDKKLLLILDNCEHLILEAAQFVDNLLHAAAQLRVLVTSREALGIAGEAIYLVPSLTTPDPDRLPELADLAGIEAMRLFVERARAVLSGFSLTQANASPVAQICKRLDGIPLALELAAAKVKVFSAQQICERLDQRFRLLTGGSRTALPRQRTLSAAIDWSYGLLNESEKRLFRSLSVFMGGWDLAAAEAVCANEDVETQHAPSQHETPSLLDDLASLVNKSLVVVEESEGGGRRYRMLETVRQYAQEKLDEAGESASLRDRHLDYYIGIAENFEKSHKILKNIEKSRGMMTDLENFRNALSWAFGVELPEKVAQGLCLASSLHLFWIFNNLNGEGLSWDKKGLALLKQDDVQWFKICAKTMRCAAYHAVLVDRNIDGGILSRQSELLYRRCDDPLGLAYALISVVYFNEFLEFESLLKVTESERMAFLKEGEKIIREAGDEWGLYFLFETKLYTVEEKEYGLDESQITELITITRGTFMEGVEHFFWAILAEREGDLAKSLFHFQKSWEVARQSVVKVAVVWNSIFMAEVAQKLEERELAQSCYQQALVPAFEAGSRQGFPIAMYHTILICLEKGEYQQVGKHLSMGLSLAPDMEDHIFVFLFLYTVILAVEKMLQPTRIPVILGYFEKYKETFPESWQRRREEIERITTSVKATLGEAAFQSGLKAGHLMSKEQILAETRCMVEELVELTS
jgi:predicted ATPase/class 3 adenylate cyclase